MDVLGNSDLVNVFQSFSYYPQALYLTWDYGEAHHFKGMYQNYLKSVLEFINY